MAILGDLLVQGRSRFLQQIYAPGISIDGDTTVTGTLTLSKIQDAAGTANNSPALIVGGPVTSSHLEFDSNEIMAKATGTTTADLYINTDGGIIFLGKSGVKTQVQGNLQVQGTSTFTGAGTYSGNLTVNGTTSLKGTSITGDLTVSNNTKINGSLIVEDEIRTPKWIVDNIANLGGEFVIAPTIIGGDNVSVNVSAVSNGKYTITVTDSSITSSSFGGIAWSNSSIVKVSGTINDVVLISVNGTMTQALNTTTNTIQFTVNSSDVTLTAGTYTGNKVKNLHIMMYKNAGIVPVGIFMTSYGESKYPYIDIYSGSSSGSSYSPTTRLGYLTGIKDENGNALTVNGVSPTGWGLYTNNGYFSGTIVSTSGKIGGFTIGTTDIHNGKTSRTETTNNGVWVGTDGIGFGKGITYFSTDGTGKIGPWTLSTTYLRNGSITGATNTSVAGVYLGTDGLNISNGTAATTTYITKTAVNVGNKLTWNGTTLTVTGTVNATAGYFGSSSSNGWQIDSNAIKHGTLGSSGGYILNASGNSTATINGASRSNLALAIGSKFGVSNDGTLYTNGANITNISAENISTGTISVGVLPESVKNENIEIGGRNLLYKTVFAGGRTTLNGDYSIILNASENSDTYFYLYTRTQLVEGTTYVISCEASGINGEGVFYNFSLFRQGSTIINGLTINRNGVNSFTFIMNATELSHHIATTVNDLTVYRITMDDAGRNIEGQTGPITLTNFKLEKGNRATDWTPAPEDLDVHEYITDIDSNNGITIKPINTAGNDYLQINSSAISFYRNNVETLKLEDSTLRVGKLGTNLRNIYITDSEVQIRNNTTVIAKFGSTLTFYEPDTTTVAAEVDSNGINVKVGTFGNATNKITVGTGTSGHSAIRYGMTTLADTTNTGFYIGTDGIALGKGVFKVTAAGALTAKSGSIGKYTITDTYLITGTGTSATGIGGNQAFWAGNSDSNSAPFRVSYAGALVSTSATIIGTVNATAGYFGSNSTDGWSISSNAITHGTLGSSGGYILNAAGNSSATINGSSRSNLALAIGSKFGVGNDGTLYANGANITNINASNINAGTLNISYLPESVKNENIEIGGRNLFKLSDTLPTSVWVFTGGSAVNGVASLTKPSSGDCWFYQMPANGYWVWEPNTPYVASIEARITTAGGKLNINPIGAGNTAKVIDITTEWKRYEYAFVSTANVTTGSMSFYNTGSAGSVVEFRYPKLEKGNKATDWTPAPEDQEALVTLTRTWYATCDTAAATVAKVATTTDEGFELREGVVVDVKFANTNSGAVGSLTLNVNDTGAKSIKTMYNNSLANLTTAGQLYAGLVVRFVYSGTYWIAATNYNSDTVDRKRINNAVRVAENVTAYAICGRSGTGHKKLVSGLAIDISYPIAYLYAGNISGQSYAVASGSTTTTFYTSIPGVNLQSTKASWTGTQYAMCYIKGTLSGTTFTVHSDVFTTTVPTSDDGFAYIPIGIMVSTTQVNFDCDNTVYMYRNGSFHKADTVSNYINADSTGIRIASASPSTQNQRLELTSSTLKMYDASNYQRLKLDSTNGVIIGKESYGHTQVTDTGLFIYDVNNKKRAQVDNNGLSVYLSDGTTSIANFGEVTRIGKSNSDRVTVDSTNGITIYKGNSKRLQTTANGIAMYGSDGTDNIVAQFGTDGAQIGYVDTAHAEIDSNSLRFVARSAGVGPFFRVADETDENGFVQLVNSFTGDGMTTDFSLDPAPSMVPPEQYVTTVTVNGSSVPFTLALTSDGFVYVELAQAPANGAGIIVTYWCDRPVAPTLSFGQNLPSVVRGIGSVALGNYTTAEQSHSVAIGNSAHSYAEGAVAIGKFVYARGENQTVLGKNNANDPDHALEVGNGVGSWARSNAIAVNWNGAIESGIAGKGAIQWIDAARGTGAVYVPKKEGDMSNVVASLVMETSGGGAWIISNYADEYLRLSYVTGADRSAGNNTAVHPIVLNPDGSVTHRGDVGWTNLTAASGVAAYSTTQQPQYRKWGPVVNVRGAFKNNAQLASGGSLTLATLPDGCRPAKPFDVICQGSSLSKWLLTINTNGTMVASRYSNGGTAAAAGAGTWFVFNVTFMV